MKKKILLAFLVVVILLGAGFAYAYFVTDAFKTEKEMFFSYILKDDMWAVLEDEKITEYVQKQGNTPYINKGKIGLNVVGNESFSEESIEMLNKSKISFEGKTDASQKLAEQKVTLDLAQGFNIPVEFKHDGDTYGIQSNLLDSKYIAVRNENLKKLLERFNIDAKEVPDKIEVSEEQFTENELKTLKEKYFAIFNENLGEELFSKEKVGNQTVVTLKMSEGKTAEIFVKLLETVRDDQIIMDKIPQGYDKTELETIINDTIADMKEIEKSDADSLELKLYVESKDVKKYEISLIEDEQRFMNIVIENTSNRITVGVYEENILIGEFDIVKETKGNDIIYKMNMKMKSEDEGNVDVIFTIQYQNVLEQNNVEEVYDMKMSYEVEGEKMNINANYTNAKTFVTDVKIEGLNVENATILNDATDEELQNLVLKIYQNLGLM